MLYHGPQRLLHGSVMASLFNAMRVQDRLGRVNTVDVGRLSLHLVQGVGGLLCSMASLHGSSSAQARGQKIHPLIGIN
jgi:hypothetical protein